MNAAIAQAAHDTLIQLFPSQASDFSAALREDLKSLPVGRAKNNGIALGRRAAAAILALRENDGSEHTEPRVGVDYITSDKPGKWRQDPISQIPLALGERWAKVKPFVMKSARQFRVPLPPALDSRQYAATVRTDEQTGIGIFWAYDGTPSLCAPMADAAIAIWESKYYYNFWRPVTGIREADAGTAMVCLCSR